MVDQQKDVKKQSGQTVLGPKNGLIFKKSQVTIANPRLTAIDSKSVL